MPDLNRRNTLALGLAAAAIPLIARAAEPAANAAIWDLTELYPSDAAWTAERDAITAALPGLSAGKGKLGESAATLRASLQAISDLGRRLERLGTYANLKADEDLQIAANQERRQLATALYSQFGEATAWLNPEILTLGAATVDRFIAADPGLAKFRFQLADTLRLAPHTLSPEGEILLASAGQPLGGAQDIRSQLVNADIPWPEVQLARGKVRLDSQGYAAARTSPDRTERKLVFDTFYAAYKTYESSLGAALQAQVQGDIFQAKARKHPSAVAAALAAGNIPVSVYRTLVAEANRGLPVLHRYFALRQKLLGLPDMAYYDIYPPLTKLDLKFDIATTRRLTLEAVKPLGPEYGAELAKATAARWMHVYPQKGKRSGAYMNPGAYDVHPYLLLNHTDDYEGLSTYAHEWGHGMHSVLAAKSQPYETADYSIFTAEIASTLNEHLLTDHMLKTAKSKAEKLFYLDRVCELMRGTFYRQTMFAEFELIIHEAAEKGEALSGEKLTAMYLELLKRYHGPKVTIDPAYALEWAYIPHFYMNFYVYQYATCTSASAYFAQQILSGKKGARDNYLSVLKAGGSDYPVDILKRAGLDMTTPAPYRAVVDRFAATLDEMETLVG